MSCNDREITNSLYTYSIIVDNSKENFYFIPCNSSSSASGFWKILYL
jgi:hypothetical protein